ncbi:hypothetical protein [Azospirillum halopraeferens]|uniref:hypothetical protein n=1 Tax=Azospirillum halopraeferens TaxID=34010 RepID=UPI0004193934|nr:hypothetical protein [Azospirillum halopraeferens]
MTVAALARSAEPLVQQARAPRGPADVEAAVRNAAKRTGVDFAYLMEKAAVESGFRTDVKAATSSATGLYQFIDQTWLTTMRDNGAKHGLARYANAIETRSDGRAVVSDPEMRRTILDLRKDPEISALMAGEFTRGNMEHLQANVGGTIGSTELYMAHFLGAGGAARFLNAMKEAPMRQARELFPEAASANKAVFYDRETGQPKTLKAIYDRFAKRFDETGGPLVSASANATERVRRGDMPDGFTTQVPSGASRTPGANPLSIYQVLALNALETPDEADDKHKRNPDSPRRMRDDPVRTAQTYETGLGLGLTAM